MNRKKRVALYSPSHSGAVVVVGNKSSLEGYIKTKRQHRAEERKDSRNRTSQFLEKINSIGNV